MKKIKPRLTIGVRYNKSPDKIYSYFVKSHKGIYLGQELVVHNDYGVGVVYVVRIDKTPCSRATKEIGHKVVPL